MREVYGQASGYARGTSDIDNGVFERSEVKGYAMLEESSGSHTTHRDFKISRVVSVGPESSPRTISVLYWRRVA